MRIRLRSLQAEDRLPIQATLQETQHFTSQEIEVALELVDAVLDQTDPDYQFIVAEKPGGHFAGYGCWGETPLTSGTYDLYWIAVSPKYQKQGIGGKILSHIEAQIMKNRGRLLLIETSSTEVYQDTQAFYTRHGYVLESRISDFYKSGDDKLIYTKRFRRFG